MSSLFNKTSYAPSPKEWELCKSTIIDKLKQQPQQFGRGDLYQAHEGWGIPGQRPTLQRISEYQLGRWLPVNAQVLDIGCNIGMFGLALSDVIDTYYGFDNNLCLIEIAKHIADVRRIENCDFECKSFQDFSFDNKNRTYDAVFSFAVHVWIGMSTADYAVTLNGLLNLGGVLVLESNRLDTNDSEFFQNVSHFIEAGFSIRFCGRLKDDGIIERGFYILVKEACS